MSINIDNAQVASGERSDLGIMCLSGHLDCDQEWRKLLQRNYRMNERQGISKIPDKGVYVYNQEKSPLIVGGDRTGTVLHFENFTASL